MQVGTVTPSPPVTAPQAGAAQPNNASSAFGLSFEALLKIILTQLTYQDPLKPMDNFEFVSQLAQFSQIQLGQNTNDRLQAMATAQANLQASSLLGRQVDVPAGAATLTGKVVAVSLQGGDPRLTIETVDKQTIGGIPLATVTQIR